MTTPTNTQCNHCGGDLKIRNPKGYCDHLYYPENCKQCSTPDAIGTDTVREWEEELDKELSIVEMIDSTAVADFKFFIKSLLTKEKTQLLERVEREINGLAECEPTGVLTNIRYISKHRALEALAQIKKEI